LTGLFAACLLLSLALAGAIAFSTEKARPRLKWLLILSLFLTWGALGLSLKQIVARTSATLVTPGGPRQPHLADPATREGLILLAAMGGPALLATALGFLALRASRPGRRQAPPG
jgi:hypothetical protein